MKETIDTCSSRGCGPGERSEGGRHCFRADGNLLNITLLLVTGMLSFSLVSCPERPLSQESREAVLVTNLSVIRDSLNWHLEERGSGPEVLEQLVERGYLEILPIDPMTRSRRTWRAVRDSEGLIIGVRSGSSSTGLDGSRYSEW